MSIRPNRSIDILGGQAWSYAAIPFIFIFMLLIRTGCMALFNLTAFTWIKERESACGRGLVVGLWLGAGGVDRAFGAGCRSSSICMQPD